MGRGPGIVYLQLLRVQGKGMWGKESGAKGRKGDIWVDQGFCGSWVRNIRGEAWGSLGSLDPWGLRRICPSLSEVSALDSPLECRLTNYSWDHLEHPVFYGVQHCTSGDYRQVTVSGLVHRKPVSRFPSNWMCQKGLSQERGSRCLFSVKALWWTSFGEHTHLHNPHSCCDRECVHTPPETSLGCLLSLGCSPPGGKYCWVLLQSFIWMGSCKDLPFSQCFWAFTHAIWGYP